MKSTVLLSLMFCSCLLSAQNESIIVSLLEEDHNFGGTEWEHEAFEEIEEQFWILEDRGYIYEEEALLNYLKQVLDRIKPAGMPDIPLRIYVFEDPSVNALMYMDGRIALTTGILASLSTEGELAFLLAHELSHLIYRHGVRMLRKVERTTRNLMSLRAKERQAENLAYYSQDFEIFADSLGLELLRAAGYRQEHAYSMLNKLPKKDEKSSQVGFLGRSKDLGRLPPSHPSGASRLAYIEELFLTTEELLVEDEADYLSMTKKVRYKNLDIIYQSGRLNIIPSIDSLIANLSEEGADYRNQLNLVRAEILLRSIDNQAEVYNYYYLTHPDEVPVSMISRRGMQRIYEREKPELETQIIAAAERLLDHPDFACKSNRLLGLYYHKVDEADKMKIHIETCLRLAEEEESIRLPDRRFLLSLIE